MIKKINLDKLLFIYSILFIVGIPFVKLVSYYFYLNKILDDIFVINQAYVLWIMIPPLIISYLIGLKQKRFKIDWLDILTYHLIVITIISSIFSDFPKVSLFGSYTRYEGLLSLVSYYLIFLNFKNYNNKKYINYTLNILFGVGIFQVIYSLIQIFTDASFVVKSEPIYMGMGLCGNPNFFGSYMVMLSLYTCTQYIINNKHIILSVIFFLGLVLAASTGPFIGFVLAFIFFLICFRKHINIKRVGIILLLYILTFFAHDSYQDLKFNSQIDKNYNIKDEITEIIKNDKPQDINRVGNGRFEIWINSLPLIKDYFLLGSGPDTFLFVYKAGIVDKAHNVYLQMLITTGIISLGLFLLILFILFINSIRVEESLTISLLIAFIGYSIQAFANISTIDVAPVYFILTGLLYYKNKKLINKTEF
jgi:putative inorganic carbon (HCO3(-)) transporter